MSESTPKQTSPQGVTVTFQSPEERMDVLRQAVDYRGDVTLTLEDGSQVQGYIFDQRPDDTPPTIRLMLADTGEKRAVPMHDIAQLSFSGRDTADGKGWETWVRKYRENKARGEAANILPDSLDE